MENPYEDEGYIAPSYEDIVFYTRGFTDKPKESKKPLVATKKSVGLKKAA